MKFEGSLIWMSVQPRKMAANGSATMLTPQSAIIGLTSPSILRQPKVTQPMPKWPARALDDEAAQRL